MELYTGLRSVNRLNFIGFTVNVFFQGGLIND